MADIAKAKTLGELLATKRNDYLGRPDEFDQYVVADAIGYTQTYVSKIENSRAEHIIPRWPSKKQLALLRAYRFTDEEIVKIAAKFGLDVNLNVENFTPPTLQTLDKVAGHLIRDVERPDEGGVVLLEGELQGYRPEDCIFVTLRGGSLICPEVRQRYEKRRGARLFFARTKAPREGSIVLYRVDDDADQPTFVLQVHHEVQPVVPVVVSQLKGDRYLVLEPDNPPLTLIGTAFLESSELE